MDALNDFVDIALFPLGKTLRVKAGTWLQHSLFTEGVEFPCGGRGRCKGCKVKVLDGHLPVTAEEKVKLSPAELAEGWRLSCRHRANTPLKLEMAQWQAAILADDSKFEFVPRDGFGVAVDLGTTTLVAQLLDMQTGAVLAVRTALNPQARHGGDIMSRIEFAVSGGQGTLTDLIRSKIGELVSELVTAAALDPSQVRQVSIVGNTVMHHLFCGISVESLSQHPFESAESGMKIFAAAELGWPQYSAASVCFLPSMGSFVGSDLLAGVLATRLHEGEALVALVDLGTNGEIVIGNRSKILCASTAAGPAFEGARISCGMRAATGAISAVALENGRFVCSVIGGTEPRGLCGSGLVDAVAAALDLGLVQPSGRFHNGNSIQLEPTVSLTQADIRELQLAKGAIAAGIRVLASEWGATLDDISRVYLAGAFGNYINRVSARRIGLLPFPLEKVQTVGNSALLGAKMSLFDTDPQAFASILERTRHVAINEHPDFVDIFAEEICFP